MINPDNIRIADWHDKEDQQALLNIRRKVFIEEQGVPEELEWDEEDHTAKHFLYFKSEKPIACGRILKNGHIGRMAVLKAYRKQNIGSSLLQYIIQDAKKNKVSHLSLHAQLSALDFYQKHGFQAYDDIFMEAGIEHQSMKLIIKK